MKLGKVIDECDLPNGFLKQFLVLNYEICTQIIDFWKINCPIKMTDKCVKIEFIDIPIIGPRSKKISDSEYSIIFPISLSLRIWLFSHIVLTHYEQEFGVIPSFDPSDYRNSYGGYIPKRFQPVFEVYDNLKKHVEAINTSLYMVTPDLRYTDDVFNLLSISHYFLISHELTHIAYNHDKHIEQALSDYEFKLIQDVNSLKKAIEVHADRIAARMTLKYLLHLNGGYLEGEKLFLLLHRYCYSMALLFTVFDTRSKYLLSPELEEYSNSFIRYELFRTSIEEQYSDEIRKGIWTEIEKETWIQVCHHMNKAFNESSSDLDVRLADKAVLPLHALSWVSRFATYQSSITYADTYNMYQDYLNYLVYKNENQP